MPETLPEVIFHNGRITTLDRANPVATAVAIRDGRFVAVGSDEEVLALRAHGTRVIDLRGRCVLPGLVDNHTHVVRGGLNYNLELRWDGVRSLADAMDMLRRQVAVTPAPQWVRVVGGSPSTSSWKSACPPFKKSMPSRRRPRCSCCTYTTAHC